MVLRGCAKDICKILIGGLGIGMLLYCGNLVYGQGKEKVEILNANKLKHTTIKGKSVRKLVGEVRLKYKETLMDCDSAHQYEEQNRLEAFSNVHIRKGDSIHLTGNRLTYDPDKQKAVMKEDVLLEQDTMTLETDTLHYNLRKDNAYYNSFGVIKDGENRLTSYEGYYFANEQMFHFRDSVRLKNPDYLIFSDTLQYERPTTKAFFKGPTEIISDTNYLYCERGWYNTQKGEARFGKNTCVQSGEKYLYADSLYYDRKGGYGEGLKNIRIYDTLRETQISGDYGEFYRDPDTGDSYVADSALGWKIHKKDTFFLHADTLRAGLDSTGDHRLFRGYFGARSFNSNLQSQCDSLLYSTSDSIVYMYHYPVIWMNEYQITADHIRLLTDGQGTVEKMKMLNDAMIISKIDSQRFNQVKGRNMTAYFRDNELYKIDVKGNSQAIYYLTDKNDKFVGVNEIQSSDITIHLTQQEIEKINFKEQPEATVFPPKTKSADAHRLEGFQWLAKIRPLKVYDLFRDWPITLDTEEDREQDEGTPGKLIKRTSE